MVEEEEIEPTGESRKTEIAERGFTPGPWSVHDGDQHTCKCLSVSGGQRPIATVESGEWGDSYPSIRQMKDTGSIEGKFEAYIERIPYGEIPEEEALANARLIAAAPALYEAAKAALDYIKVDPVLDDDGIVTSARLRAALALVDDPQTKGTE